ncbi:unnamed protein product [Brachionus calyciflorus]|uniref:PABC domain-containing protein n=1 Tax=Brachionus calyciflorus TaxID=104777 RepID=A0A814N7H3_9BILA|nr:unnamed protein product [Brachionus calyciflorus]
MSENDDLEDQKEILREKLHPLVKEIHPEWVDQIIDILLELDNEEIINLIERHDFLEARVEEALVVVEQIENDKQNSYFNFSI